MSLLCNVRGAGEEGGASSQHAQIAAALSSPSLPADGTSWDFIKRLKEEIELSQRKCFFFFSFDAVLPLCLLLLWHILHFFIPQTGRGSP